MILVTLGTQDKDFSRLLKAIDNEIEKKHITDKVIVQAGTTKYESNNMEIFDLISKDELSKLVEECDLLITHGGVGSILDGIKNNKKIIAAARLKKYKEHTNDHQKQIVKTFAEKGYILELKDFSKLDKVLEKAKTFKPKKFKSNTKNFVKMIDDYIEKDNHTSWFNRYRYLCSNGFIGIFLTLINVLIFSILFGKVNFYLNILISYIATGVLSLIINKLFDVEYKNYIKTFVVIRLLNLILDLDIMYIFNKIINYNLIVSKFITGGIIIILTYIVIKFCFKEKIIKGI